MSRTSALAESSESRVSPSPVPAAADDPAILSLCEALAWRAVPRDADWCLVDVLGDPSRGIASRRLAVAHAVEEDAVVARALLRFPFICAPDSEGRISACSTDALVAEAGGGERAEVLRALGTGTAWRAPVLSGTGAALGLFTLVCRAGRDAAGAAETAQRLAAGLGAVLERAALRTEADAARADAKLALERTLRLQAVTQALSGARSREELVEVAVLQGLQALGASAGSMALLDEGLPRLRVRSVGYAPCVSETWRDVSLEERFPLTDVVREGDAIFLRNAEERLARYPHLAELVRQNGVGAMAALPLWLDGRPIGALGLNFDAPRDFDEAERAFVNTLARLCSQSIERVRHVEAEQHARQRLELVAEAGRLLSSTLDYEQTLQNVAALMLPHLGDFCFFDLREESGDVRRIARARVPRVQAMLQQSRWAPNPKPELNLCALTSGRVGLHADIDDAFYERMAASPEHLALLRTLDFNSLLTVPMHLGGELVGSMTMAYAESRRRHGAEERGLAEELARRAAVAVQHARLMRETRRAVAVRDEFLSVAGHELNTPLTTLKLQLTSLQRQGAVAKAVEQKLQGANRQVDRLARLVRALLDVSRFETGRLVLDLQDVEVVSLLRDVVDRQLEHPTLAGAVWLDCPERVVMRGDPLRLDQLFGNLVSNAMKYGGGRPIDVRVTVGEESVRVSVADRGIGIAPEDQQRVFDRFQRAVSAQHYGGFGVGLWIVREVARAHGGEVTLRSEPGEGATFTVELPLAGPRVAATT